MPDFIAELLHYSYWLQFPLGILEVRISVNNFFRNIQHLFSYF